eukprot:5810764-Amphidinium_carterae.2
MVAGAEHCMLPPQVRLGACITFQYTVFPQAQHQIVNGEFQILVALACAHLTWEGGPMISECAVPFDPLNR